MYHNNLSDEELDRLIFIEEEEEQEEEHNMNFDGLTDEEIERLIFIEDEKEDDEDGEEDDEEFEKWLYEEREKEKERGKSIMDLDDEELEKCVFGEYQEEYVIDETSENEILQQQLKAFERKVFYDSPKTGANAHAFNKNYDNVSIYNLRSKGYSFRKIAKELGIASPNTVRNRYKKMIDELLS